MFHARHFDFYFSLGKLLKSTERKFELVKTWIFLSSGIVPELLGSLGFQSSNQQFRPPTNKRARFPIWTNQCARLKLNHITITLIGDWCLIVLMHQSHCFESVPKLYSKQAAPAAVT